MTPLSILISFLAYTCLLFVISWLTSRKADNDSFFIGNRVSPWYVVAYGMIGASLSGVTFVSIPGDVGNSSFSYMVIVFGYLLGYFIIARVLLPIYYKMNLTSIYTFLEERFGLWSYKSGAFYFLLSRVIGASFRMFLVVNVLQVFVFDAWNVPFIITVSITMLLILLYTFRGGIKTIVWTDTLQTTFMLVAVILTVFMITKDMGISLKALLYQVYQGEYGQMIFTEIDDKRHFLKQFFSGVFIAVVMTGLDQDMMQKNLSCKNLKDAQKNIYWLSISLVPVNFLFLSLGGILYIYASSSGLQTPEYTDDLFPAIALRHLSPLAGIVFIIGLISAAYSSADSALTALTTSFSIDFLSLKKRENLDSKRKTAIRQRVHIGFAILILLVILVFKAINDKSVIFMLFKIAGYTYGPLLGLFSFGIISSRTVNDKVVPYITVFSILLALLIDINSKIWFSGFEFGFMILLVNGFLTLLLLSLFSRKMLKEG